MKSIKRFVAVVIACVAIAVPASAQFSFGIKAGAKINEIPENIGAFEFDDCAGFTGGVMGEFTLPIVGLGIDASLMYSYEPLSGELELGKKETFFTGANHYLDIPINLKYKLSIPAIEKFVAPYVFTGPNFSFMLSKEEWEPYMNKRQVSEDYLLIYTPYNTIDKKAIFDAARAIAKEKKLKTQGVIR